MSFNKSSVYRTRSVTREERINSKGSIVDEIEITNDFTKEKEKENLIVLDLNDDNTEDELSTDFTFKKNVVVDLVESDSSTNFVDDSDRSTNFVDESDTDDDIGDGTPASKRNLVLVFDVKTTDLILKREPMQRIDVKNSPYILQLCFIIFDLDKQEIIARYNSYIDIHDSVIISPKITSRTGIVRDLCNNGNTIDEVLFEFYHWYILCNEIVAHNLQFDKEMIIIECIRNYDRMKVKHCEISILFSDIYNNRKNKLYYCTMLYGKNVCNILRASSYNSSHTYKKYPTLSELHETLFIDNTLPQCHDASMDVMVCLKCYLSLNGIENVTF